MALSLADIPKKCINLRRRPDRWTDFTAQPGLAKFGPVERSEAVDAQNLDVETDPNVALSVLYNIKNNERRSHHEIVSKGSIACYYSHVNLWKWLVEESNAPALCVMEDDLKVDPDSFDKLQELLNDPATRSTPWDIFNPGAFVASKTHHRLPIERKAEA